MMPGLRSIDLSLNRSLLAAREVKTPTGWIIPPDLNALVILQPQSQTSSIRHLVCVFKSYPLRKAGSQNDKYSSTHRLGVPNATQPFRPWLRQELGVLGRFGDTVIVGGLATLRMPGSLEIGRRPTWGRWWILHCSALFWDTKIVTDYLECLNTWDTWATSCWSGGFPRSKVEQCEAIGIADAPCGCGLLGLRCASRCDAAARGWLWPTGRFHGWFAAGIFIVGWGVSSSFPDLPSQNRIYSIRRWIENRSNQRNTAKWQGPRSMPPKTDSLSISH